MSCENVRCEHGWVKVLDGYVERMAPEPELPEGEGDEADAERERLTLEWTARVAALKNTWYPCGECNRKAFHQWRGGHWDPLHNREDCDTCVAPGQRARRTQPEPIAAGHAAPPGYPQEQF